MASVKLNALLRERILNDLIERKFSKEFVALMNDYKAFSERLYDHFVSPEDQKRIQSLPPNFLPSEDKIDFVLGGQRHSVKFNGALPVYRSFLLPLNTSLNLRSPIEKKLPYGVYRERNDLQVRSVLGKEYASLTQRREYLEDRVKKAEMAAKTALRSVSTTGRLREVWPEIGPFLDPLEKRASSARPAGLPAVDVGTLNSMLDLPVHA